MISKYFSRHDVLNAMVYIEAYFANHYMNVPDEEKCWALGQWIITRFLGVDWFDKNATENASHNFLYSSSAVLEKQVNVKEMDSLSPDQAQMTFVDALINISDIPNFDYFLGEIKRQEFSAAHAEVLIAHLLWSASLSPAVVIRRGKKGSDYEFDVQLPEGVAAVEVKHKDQEKEFSINNLKNTFNGARTQFPADRPGFLFLHIPSAWLYNEEFWAVAEDAANSFLRVTQRINKICLVVRVSTTVQRQSLVTLAYRPFLNPNPRFSSKDILSYSAVEPLKTLSYWPVEKLLARLG